MSASLLTKESKKSLAQNSIQLALALGVLILAAGCAGTPPAARNDAALASALTESAEGVPEGMEEECILLKLTGTNIPKKYCSSKSTWEALSKENRDIAREYTRQMAERSGIRDMESGRGQPVL